MNTGKGKMDERDEMHATLKSSWLPEPVIKELVDKGYAKAEKNTITLLESVKIEINTVITDSGERKLQGV